MDAAFVMILFVTLSYPMNNLCGFRNKLLIKGKSRVKWWLSKCIWNLLCNIIFFGIIFTLILSFCSISGIQSGMQVNIDMQTVLFNLGPDTSLKPHAIMPVGDIVMVFMLSVAICQIQMVLGLWLADIQFYGNVHGFAAVSIFSKPVCYWKLCNADKAFVDK